MLEGMGQPVRREPLERIGIYYDFEKKTCSIYLFYKKSSKKSKNNVGDAGRNSMPGRQRSEKSLMEKESSRHGSSIVKSMGSTSNQALISIVNRICPSGYVFDSKAR
ncbi:hypothetical protein C5S30_01200 [ANME-1 cluster archaeon GoMg4]|nr:hypothetical protein [ANME-1 cluster archaeon GoMg4]